MAFKASSLVQAATGTSSVRSSILTLQSLQTSSGLTSRDLTLAYLQRISQLNPLLGAVIQTNPDALAIATQLDDERAGGNVRGPLHGIPVLIKDNIATRDNMETTAGSLALVGSRVPADAILISRLRAAGAVILGKANLSEWANFRGSTSISGWSARGEFTRNPYNLAWTPLGSSSGPAVAVASGLAPVSVGTETNGSLVGPAGDNLIVGLKPTVGLIAQNGIIPIAPSQDTAGPMARTVTDVALLLGILQSPIGEVASYPLPPDYTVFLRRGTLRGARIGVDLRYFTRSYGAKADVVAVVIQAVQAMQALGATVVGTDTGVLSYNAAQATVLLCEFKVKIADYLAGLSQTSLRTLSDLIAFNRSFCSEELKYFGQEIFEMANAQSGDLSDPAYLQARAFCVQLARTQGIDAALQRDQLDAIVAPSYTLAATPAAVAGYPNISLPVGLTTEGQPVGMWMYGGFLSEPKLLALAYDLEQEIKAVRSPQFLNAVPPEPPDAGICATLGLAAH